LAPGWLAGCVTETVIDSDDAGGTCRRRHVVVADPDTSTRASATPAGHRPRPGHGRGPDKAVIVACGRTERAPHTSRRRAAAAADDDDDDDDEALINAVRPSIDTPSARPGVLNSLQQQQQQLP